MNESNEDPRLRVVEPCPMAWSDLTGNGTKRWCGSCKLHVVDGSALSRNEAEQVANSADDRVCMRLLVDSSGNAIHRESNVPRRRRAWPVSLIATGAALLTACFGDRAGGGKAPDEPTRTDPQPEQHEVPTDERPAELMGAVCIEPRPAEAEEGGTRELVGRVAPPPDVATDAATEKAQ